MSSVSINGLSKHFGGKTPTTAIDDLDLEIEQGEFLVLLGPSGCGKTTTLRCIAGLETADAGSIAFGDTSCLRRGASRQRAAEQAEHRHGLPVLRALAAHDGAQEHRLPAPLAEDQGAAGDRVDRGGRARSSTRRELLDRYPAQLSGGQQQRVALSRGPRRPPRPRALRRAALEPRRAPARAGPDRDPRAARTPRVHRRLRHARPE